MALTPQDIRDKQFTAVRLRDGYDMGEVEQFLDEVEVEFERLVNENADLKAKVAELEGALEQASKAQPAPAPIVEAPKPEPVKEPEPVKAPEPTELRVTSTHEASMAAARLLEIASANADQLMDAAKSEADGIIAEARTEADQVAAEARRNADTLQYESRKRAEALDVETDQRRKDVISGLERERQDLQAEIDHLRAYEREYRARLKAYFQDQLAQLDGAPATSPSPGGSALDGTPAS